MKTCINCSNPLNNTDKFCPECGQSTTDKLNLNILFADLIGNYLSFDARFFKTIIPLVFKPGFIAKSFISGKRNTYLHPGKIYLFISVIFFFFLSIKISSFRSDLNNSVYEGLSENIIVEDTVQTDSLQQIDINYEVVSDSIPKTSFLSTNDHKRFLNSENYVVRKIGKILDKKGQNIFDLFYGMISIAIFLLVPVYALFLKILFYKNNTYSEHLVFSLYLFTFGYILSSVYLSLYSIDSSDYILYSCFIIFFLYLTLSFKHFYQRSFSTSLVKAGVQSTIFLTFLVPTTLILLILSSILMY